MTASLPADAPADPARPLTLLAAFSLLLFLGTAATFASLGVVLPAMIRDLGWSYGQGFLGFTLMGVSCGASSWLPALTIRRIGVRATLALGATAMALGLGAFAAARSLPVYLVGAVLCGAAFQMTALIPGVHVLGGVFARRGRALGVYFTAAGLGGAAGPLAATAGLALAGGAWRLYWAALAATLLVAGLLCAAAVAADRPAVEATGPPPQTDPAEEACPAAPDWTVAEALRTPQLWVIGAAWFSHLFAASAVSALSVAHLGDRGVDAASAAGLLSVEAGVQVAVRLVGGWVADRMKLSHLLSIAQGLLAVGLLCLAFAGGWPVRLLYAVASGAGVGLTALAATLLLLRWFGRRHNLELFSLVCLSGAPAALSPALGGWVRDRLGAFTPAIVAAALAAALIGLACIVSRTPSRPLPDPRC